MQKPFITITDAGIQISDNRPGGCQPDPTAFTKKPVRVSVHRDLTLEVHGRNFSTSTNLSIDDALGIISLLTFVVSETLQAQSRGRTTFVEA